MRITLPENFRITAVGSAEHTAQDIRQLQRFLLHAPDAALTGDETYDRNQDDKWNAVDLSLMKQALLPLPADTDELVVCFSRTGNTAKIADYIVELTGADRYDIEAAIPYTDADIRYQDDGCRANQEQNDKTVRPEIAEPLASLDQYEIIWLGYPIWWGEEPRIIDTFLESYDLSEKTVIPFCTSGSSGIGTSERNIKALVPIGNQLPGKRFGANADIEQVRTWIDSLDLPKPDSDAMMELEINGTVLTAAFADTPAAQELAEKLRTAPVTLTLHEYGGFEKVGALPWELPRNDVQTVTEAGDIMLYQGNQITVFYNSNAWQYTKLGSITDADAETLAALFGDGDITITISLAGA